MWFASFLGYGRIHIVGPGLARLRIPEQQSTHETGVFGLLFDEFRSQRLDLWILRRLHDRGEVGKRALFATERELQRMPRRHHVVRGTEVGLFRAFASFEFCNLAGVGGDVEIASEAAD